MATFGERLRTARLEAGLSQGRLAKAVGLTQQAIAAMEGGREGSKHVAALADALNVMAAWLAHEKGPKRQQGQLPGIPGPIAPNAIPAPDAPPLPAGASLPLDIPVLGTGRGGTESDFELNHGDVIDYVRRLPGIAGRKGIFAIYLSGESMEPWRRPGAPIYVDPHRRARPGDHVLVELQAAEGEPSPALVKLLVAETPSQIRLAQYNPRDDRIMLARKRVKQVYRVLEWEELAGV